MSKRVWTKQEIEQIHARATGLDDLFRIVCEQCGTEMLALNPDARKYAGTFCSVKCALDYHGLSGGELCR